MSDSVIVWLGLAVLLFWAMGAYNRLVRFRSQGLQAFASLEGLLNQYGVLVKNHAPDTEALERGEVAAVWVELTTAAEQFAAALKVAQTQPLNAFTMKKLHTALDALLLAWDRLQGLPADLAEPAVPPALLVQWAQVSVQMEMARSEFNQRVVNYNEAIQQFPALLLAWMVGFKPAQPI